MFVSSTPASLLDRCTTLWSSKTTFLAQLAVGTNSQPGLSKALAYFASYSLNYVGCRRRYCALGHGSHGLMTKHLVDNATAVMVNLDKQ